MTEENKTKAEDVPVKDAMDDDIDALESELTGEGNSRRESSYVEDDVVERSPKGV